MSHRLNGARCALLLCSLVAASALAQRLPPDAMAQYGGLWSANCANPAAPRLRVLADGLAVERDNQRLLGRQPQAAYSYLGNSPPRNFDVALLSEVPGASELIFMVYRDPRGRYIQIDAGPKTAAALGPQLRGLRYRQCNAPPPPVASAPPAPPPVAAGSPEALLASPRFKSAWRAALGADARERWLAQRDGPAPAPRWVTMGGQRYVLNAFCKAHDCQDNNAIALFHPESSQVIGLVQRNGRNTLLGAPPPPVAAELQRLWAAEWRQGR